MLSFIIAGLGCLFAGLCYAEFASMIPIAGSAYTYAYATMGEFVAWVIGWALILEYALASLVGDAPARRHLGRRGQTFVSEHCHFHRTVNAYRKKSYHSMIVPTMLAVATRAGVTGASLC